MSPDRWQAGWRVAVGLPAVLALLCCVGFWWAERSGESPPEIGARSKGKQGQVAKPFPLSVPLVKNVDGAQRTGFLPLRTTPEGLPKSIEKIMREPSYGTNWDLAQRIPLGRGDRLWLIPGNGFLCALSLPSKGTLGQVCSPTPVALAHGVAVVSLKPRPRPGRADNRVMVGIAPAGARKVLVETGRQTKALPVRKTGVFVLRDAATDPPDILRLR